MSANADLSHNPNKVVTTGFGIDVLGAFRLCRSNRLTNRYAFQHKIGRDIPLHRTGTGKCKVASLHLVEVSESRMDVPHVKLASETVYLARTA